MQHTRGTKTFVFFLLPLLLAASCREESTELSHGSDGQFFGPFRNIPDFVQDVGFCKNIGRSSECKEANSIASDANELAGRSYYFGSDPCGTDGTRDAFRHIYTMVWLTGLYGIDFARQLHDHKDPDPKKIAPTNKQVACQRNMDRRNNEIGMGIAMKLFQICEITFKPKETWSEYTKFRKKVEERGRDQGYQWDTDCVGYNVAALITGKSQTFANKQLPWVISRNPADANDCNLVSSTTKISAKGRAHCKPGY